MHLRRGWHVLGKGAVGCLWAANLQRAGIPVTLLVRTTCPESKRRECIEVRPLWKDAEVVPWSATVAIDYIEASCDERKPVCTDDDGIIYRLVVATKAQDAGAAVASVAHRLAPNVILVMLQNGLGAAEDVCGDTHVAFRSPRVIVGTTTNGSYMLGAFQVAHAGRGHTWLGTLAQNAFACDAATLTSVAEELSATGFALNVDPQIERRLWYKLAANSSLNPITALACCRNGRAIEQVEVLRTIRAVAVETAGVMRQSGVSTLPADELARDLYDFTVDVAARNAENYSSMCRDVLELRRTEIDYMNGYLIRRARQHRIVVPTVEMLYGLIKCRESTFPQASIPPACGSGGSLSSRI